MTEQNQLDALLLHYEELRARGTSASPEELCRDCPELTVELRRRIRDLESMNALLGGTDSRDVLAGATPPDPGSAGPSVSQPAEAVRTESRYQILHFHAKGGLGEVHVARDEQLHREVALKRLQTLHARNPHSRSRFLREAAITSRLEHPSIVPVHSMGQGADGRPFYAMRLIQGQTLQEAIQQFHARGPALFSDLALRQLLSRFVTVCNTIAYAHSKGIVHRDIKPSNIMLGPYGETLVVDWGLAKEVTAPEDESASTPRAVAEAGSPTQTGAVLGTPAYMSPEQAAGRADLVGPASDVYSLGATLYVLLTRHPPFEGDQVGKLIEKVKRGQFLRPCNRRKDIAPALEAVCLKAMSQKPEDRYATPLEMATDLEHWLADEPVSAWPEPWTVQLRRFLGRHRTMVTATAVTVVVATAASIVSLVLLAAANNRERTARIDAQEKAREAQEQRLEAERQKQKSDANYQLAREAVDNFHTQVSESGEFKAHGLEPLRLKLLQSVVEFYQRFVAQDPDNPQLQGERGEAYRRLGNLYRFLGQHKQSEEALLQAVAILQQVVEAHPHETHCQRGLADSYRGLGLFHSTMHHTTQAEQAYQQARLLYEQLSQSQPADLRDLRELARTDRFLGRLYFETGRKTLAEQAYQRALALRQHLADSHPHDRECRFELADSHEFMAFLYRRTGRNDLAEQAFRQARTHFQQLVEDHPQVPGYQLHLAASHSNLAVLHKDTGATDLAEQEHQQSRAILQQLADNHPQVPEYQSKVAKSILDLGQLYYDTGRKDLAEQAYQHSLALFQRLAAANPQVAAYQDDLAGSHNTLGILYYSTGRPELARQAYQEALTIERRLADAHPQVPQYQKSVAANYSNIALLDKAAGRPGSAEQAFLQARVLLQRLVEEHPQVPEYQLYLAACHNNLGTVYGEIRRDDLAEQTYQQAHVIYQRLADRYPEVSDYTIQLGGSCWNLGHLLRNLTRPDEALHWYAGATGPLEALLRKDPKQAKAREVLLNIYGGRAVALAQLGRHTEAEQELQRAEQIDKEQSRGNVRYFGGDDIRAYQARVLVLAGDHARATAVADELLKSKSLRGAECQFIAFTYALAAAAAEQDPRLSKAERASLSERYATGAVALLRRAQATGCFGNAAAVEQLRSAKELTVLRSREDFQKLVKELEENKQTRGR